MLSRIRRILRLFRYDPLLLVYDQNYVSMLDIARILDLLRERGFDAIALEVCDPMGLMTLTVHNIGNLPPARLEEIHKLIESQRDSLGPSTPNAPSISG